MLHPPPELPGQVGGPSRIRTCGLRIRSPTLYPTELWAPALWRRGRDSNPRYSFGPYTGLANQRLQPLGHLSQLSSRKCRPAEAPAEPRLLDRRPGAVKAGRPTPCIRSGMPLPIEDYAIVA